MAHIELDTEDLTLLSNDINDISNKLIDLKTVIDTKFENAKKMEVYDNGFNNIKKYLEKEIEKLNGMKLKIESQQSDVMNIEKTYGERFSNLVIPSLQSGDSSLAVQPSSSVLGSVSAPVNTQGTSGSQTNINPFASDTTDSAPIGNTSSNTGNSSTTYSNPTDSSDSNSGDETVNYAENSEAKKDGNGNGNNIFGVLAGATGVIGAGGLATAAVLRAKDDNDDKKEEDD